MAANQDRIRSQRSRGSVSVICILIMCLALLLACTLAMDSATRLRVARKYNDRDGARCVAEAGLDYGLTMLKTNPGYVGTESSIRYGDGAFSVSIYGSGATKTVSSTGTLTNGTSVSIESRFSSSGSYLQLPNAAIVSSGDATITGNGNCGTYPAGQHQASVYANGDVSLKGNAEVDGGVYAHGTASGNEDSIPLGIHSGAPLVEFPTQAQTDAWQNDLASTAMAGTTKSGGGNQTWTSPVYVDGDLSISNGTLTILGGGVVYVNGDIKLSGHAAIVNTGILACSGTLSMSGQSRYAISGEPNHVGIVSFASGDAMKVTGQGSSSPMGLFYAANGGITMTGNGELCGSLIAANGNVRLTGNGGVSYPVDLLSGSQVVPSGAQPKAWLER